MSPSRNVTASSERQATDLVVARLLDYFGLRTDWQRRFARASEPQKGVTPAVCRSRDGSGVFEDNYRVWEGTVKHRFEILAARLTTTRLGSCLRSRHRFRGTLRPATSGRFEPTWQIEVTHRHLIWPTAE